MSCAVCGESTKTGAIPITVPERLYGKDACGRCASSLQALAEGRLTKDGLEAFVRSIEAQGRQSLAMEVRRVWADPGAARAAAATHTLPSELAAIATTSGFNFDGYRVVGYLGFVSSEVVMGMGAFRAFTSDFADFFGTESQSLGRKLTDAKAAAFERLRRQVHDLGGNGIIGTDLDYTMFGTTLVGVIASGTAVYIEAAA